MLVEVTAALSGLATVGVGINLIVNLRGQRDMAQLENKILSAINGKYISRNEHKEIEKGRDILVTGIEGQVVEMEERINDGRAHHHELHEEFIACRASHQPEGGK
ncbi:MAG: hypothetical protein JXR49_02570 [Acidobacteria bacterium]|nr:hypothetical protein [Acidobacteriota bacterium]